jgi:hypothetical protein
LAETRLTAETIAATQTTFREANERIEAAADEMGLVGPIPFICECADATCFEIVRLTMLQYEEVREHPRRFFSVAEHETAAVAAGASEVAFVSLHHVLLDKIGVAGEIAEHHHDEQLA